MKKIVPFLILFVLPLFSQEGNSSKPLIHAAGSPQVMKGTGHFLVEGLTLVPGGTEINQVHRDHGVHILLEKGSEPELAEELREYLNHPLSEELIAKIKSTIVKYFRKKDGQYVAAIVPIQKVVNGVVVIQILEGHVGTIQYKGQKWFSERVIANALGIKPGDPLIETDFLNDVTWANRNPFRNTQIVLGAGKEKGTTDLVFVTKDKFPARFYVGADNTGFVANNVNRIYGGFNWGNAFKIGDILSYQYTAAPNFHDFQSHVANYTSFLPWKHVFTVYGTYGTVFPTIPNFKIEGLNVQASARYQIPIRPLYGMFRSYVEFGFDYKFLRSNLFFVGDIAGSVPSNQLITITDFLTTYSFQKNWTRNLLTFRIDMILSPWKDVFPHQTSAAYNSLREFSHVRYAYWRASVSNVYRTLKNYTISAQFRGQLATGTLPTAEQFGLGGASTVRGYFEQQFVADNAVVLNLEAYTPNFKMFKKFDNALSFLAFVDYGYGYNYSAVSPPFIAQTLMGIGPGIRYDIPPYLSVKMDYGFQVFAIEQDDRFGRFHFSAILSY